MGAVIYSISLNLENFFNKFGVIFDFYSVQNEGNHAAIIFWYEFQAGWQPFSITMAICWCILDSKIFIFWQNYIFRYFFIKQLHFFDFLTENIGTYEIFYIAG